MKQELRIKVIENGIAREAKPEEIYAWHQMHCFIQRKTLCMINNNCRRCPLYDLDKCEGVNIEASKRIIENKDFLLEVLEE